MILLDSVHYILNLKNPQGEFACGFLSVFFVILRNGNRILFCLWLVAPPQSSLGIL